MDESLDVPIVENRILRISNQDNEADIVSFTVMIDSSQGGTD